MASEKEIINTLAKALEAMLKAHSCESAFGPDHSKKVFAAKKQAREALQIAASFKQIKKANA